MWTVLGIKLVFSTAHAVPHTGWCSLMVDSAAVKSQLAISREAGLKAALSQPVLVQHRHRDNTATRKRGGSSSTA